MTTSKHDNAIEPPTSRTRLGHKLGQLSLIDAIVHRRSRRFAIGNHLEGGPLAYKSEHAPVPLSREEEAILAFAGAGITGFCLGELPYAPGSKPESGSGNIMFSTLGRTIASPDAHHNVILCLTNDDGAFMLKRPQDFEKDELAGLAELARQNDFVGLYERCRVQLSERRPDPTREVPFVPPFNKWSTNLPGATYFVPVNELTAFYVNVLLSILNEEFGYYVVDERNGFKPAGLAAFKKSRGGHLFDDPRDGRVITVQYLEAYILEMVAVEQGLMLQNIQLAAEALGLGGFPHYAAHHFAWFQALGFRMDRWPLSRFMRKGPIVTKLMDALGKNPEIPIPIGLERGGKALIKPYCPPYYASMTDAVNAMVEFKYGKAHGTFRDGGKASAWKDPARVQAGIPEYSRATIDAVIAYCEYIFQRYGRITANFGSFRTNLGYQAHHIDLDYYDRFYVPGVYSDAHRQHFQHWHSEK